jgi:hypothetical protein
MGDAEQKAPKSSDQRTEGSQDKATLKAPPSRPALVPPPRRPEPPVSQESGLPDGVAERKSSSTLQAKVPTKPAAPAAKGEAETGDHKSSASAEGGAVMRNQPIAPPSEPMQYRAIGLVRGIYQPESEEQLNRGRLTTDDGCDIDAVLLGRVTSLVKKHIDLAAPHLWVVYPRTRDNEEDLHLQIVGVWEPETLGLPGESPVQPEEKTSLVEGDGDEEQLEADATVSADLTQLELPENSSTAVEEFPEVDDNFFSIRGEVVKYSPEDETILVKILQGMKRSPKASKAFRLMLHGAIEGRTVGYFWDFEVKREAHLLVLQDASVVGIVPPKKRPKGSRVSGRPRPSSGRPMGGNRRSMPTRQPSTKGSVRPRKPETSRD